jgi:hypothetical protein
VINKGKYSILGVNVHAVDYEKVLELKRTAFNQHKSQQDLQDCSDGEFIECCFQNIELFHRYEILKIVDVRASILLGN